MTDKIGIVDGVNLYVETTDQFMTTQISINFAAPKENADLAGRFLASNFLETVSKKYPSQQKFTRILNKLYGANFNVNVSNLGGVHNFCVNLEIVNFQLLNSNINLLNDAFSFLQTILYEPLGTDEDGFDPIIFSRQKEIALNEIEGLNDDKEYQIVRTTIENSFLDSKLGLAAYGNKEALMNVTALSAWKAYKKLLINDQVDIVVVGPIFVEQIQYLIKTYLPFKARSTKLIVKENPVFKEPQTKYLYEPVKQAQMMMSWKLRLNWSEYFASYVLNSLLGGNGISRLFLSVRERSGLAYNVYSDLNFYTDLLFVVAGVKMKNVKDTRQMILNEVEILQDEFVNDDELEQNKQLILNEYLLSQDQIHIRTEQKLIQIITKRELTQDEWRKKLECVTKYDLQRLAQRLQPQLEMFLQREGSEMNEK